ncbi:ankyrin repeat-containing domain protein [Xylogone sp. PMI_703]|nr:ankyrin repeat-containing domain protein [Xylogone sp. PMI_703]
MDPLSAIGLASAVVQFVEFGLRVASRLEEFNSKNPGEVPRSLQIISTQLPLLLNALSRIASDSQIKNLDFDTKCIIRGMVTGCRAQVAEVETMINEIARAPGDSFKVKIKKVFASLKYDEKIWEIERNLHTYISVLILHHVVDSAEAPPLPVDDTYFDVREKQASPFVERPALIADLDNYFHDAARSQVQSPSILFLAGEKGVGKTQLALEYCHQTHSVGQFRTVFWLDASTLENLCLGLESMYATIKRSVNGSRTDKISFVRGFLGDLWHPWLLVLDNYETSVLYNDIMDLLPTRGYGGIILITRDTAQNGLGKVLLVPKFLTSQEQEQLNGLLATEVHRKNVEGIKYLVNQGADVNLVVHTLWPILHRVAMFGLEDAVSFLLSRGANPNPDIKISKPLYWAAREGSVSICCLLLDHEDAAGPYMTLADNQEAFNGAAKEGKLEVVQMIWSRRKVELNKKSHHDETPLQAAAKKGHAEVIKFLIEQGALVQDHEQGDKALTGTASGGHFGTVKILCLEGKVDPNAQDEQGTTALYHAAGLKDSKTNKENGKEMAVFLLDQGADPNLGNSDTPLNRASIYGHLNMMKLLLEHGADPAQECGGFSPLSTAIKYNTPEAVTLLLEANISDHDARNIWLERSLRYACSKGERGIVLQLIKAGTNINSQEEDSWRGATPLLIAILYGHPKTAQLLVRNKALQTLPDELGRLPLPSAAENDFDLLVRDLIRAGGDPNMKSGANEDTPLILAAMKGHEKVVRVLLQNGADIMEPNKFGDTVLDIAEEKGSKDMVELLGNWDKNMIL